MGVCSTKQSIQEIIHSKYKLARQQNSKYKNQQSHHVYIWKYEADQLQQREVLFYKGNVQNLQNLLERKNQKKTEQRKGSDSDSQNNNFIIGKPWNPPLKTQSDEGYIILTIKNNKRNYPNTFNNIEFGQKSKEVINKVLQDFRHKQFSLQILQILFMIHLDSFKSYYFTQIVQSQNAQFQANIEIIVGDLLDRISCLKLLSISFELQKYLKSGGQNIIKKFYNQYQNIQYINYSNNTPNHPFQVKEQLKASQNNKQKHKNNIISEQTQVKLVQSKQFCLSPNLDLQRVLQNDIRKISASQSFKNQEEKTQQVYKLLRNFYITLSQFHIFRISLLKQFQPYFKILTNKKPSQSHIVQIQQKLISQRLQQISKVKENQNEKILIFQQFSHKNVRNQDHLNFKNNKHQNVQNDQNEISMISKPQLNGKHQNENKQQDLDISSPFMCEITQINGIQDDDQSLDFNKNNQREDQTNLHKSGKKDKIFTKNKSQAVLLRNGQMQDSLFLPKQLQELKIDKNLYKIQLKSKNLTDLTPQIECPILLTSYIGSSQYQQLQKNQVTLIINLSPGECYNYFINDFTYEWYYIESIHKRFSQKQMQTKNIGQIDQKILPLFNIQCLVFEVISRINNHIISEDNQIKNQQKVALFCNHKNFIYSGTFSVAFLMFHNSFRLSFEEALQNIKTATKDKFMMPKVYLFVTIFVQIYQTQLKQIQQRVESASSTTNLNSLNTKSSSYRGYQIGLYSNKDLSCIVGRYIGELSSSNQLQLLENHSLQLYFLIPNSITSVIIKMINIMREDNSLLNLSNSKENIQKISKLMKNMGLSLRLFCGKEVSNQQKEVYFQYLKHYFLEQIIRLEYVNFLTKIFNLQKYKNKLDLIIESFQQLMIIQSIEKSFRKPQDFSQDALSFVNDLELLKKTPELNPEKRIEPFNSKQTLTFKYPILRPIFQTKKKDSFYFMIKKSLDQNIKKGNGMGCNVTFYKGENWIGLQQDKQRYFQKIVQQYLKEISQQRILIEDDENSLIQRSLFDNDSIMF